MSTCTSSIEVKGSHPISPTLLWMYVYEGHQHNGIPGTLTRDVWDQAKSYVAYVKISKSVSISEA